jgi:hypothetical protein
MPRCIRTIGVALVTLPFVVSAQAPGSKTRAYVETLASAKFEGRLAGSEGERLAGDYLVSELQRIGVKPLPGQADFREPFEFTAGAKDGGSSVRVTWTDPRTPDSSAQRGGAMDVSNGARALSFSDNGRVDAPIVFAGYGITVPESQDFGYDSYAGLEVTDKVVLVLRYFPEDADQKTRGILARYSALRYKAMLARQHGAKALLVVAGPRSPNAGDLVPMSFDTALSGSGIVAASITMPLADAIFKQTGHTLDEAQKALDGGNPHVPGFDIPNTVAHVVTDVIREQQTGRNVVGYLPATEPIAGVDKPWVAVGAHYDHLGHGDHGNSLARKEETGQIHFGADDNASGSAAVLAIARELSRQPRHRNVLVALWSGEELGLIGSSAFAKHPPVPLDQLEAYLNFDMVGRMQDNKLTIQAAGTSPMWGKVLEQANVVAGFDLQLQEDPYQPTDVATFNEASVPCLTFFTGTHVDYHRPSDTADKIDYPDLDRVVDFAAAVVRRVEDLQQAPRFTKVEPKAQPGGGRAGVRVTTGTIPDYTSEAKGLLLGGVIGGGPAEAAGLRKGDVIVEIAGQTIANIYDYTYALEVLKIGQPVKVVYMRGGERHETVLTPAARK